MKYLVIGAGGTGGCIGAYLAKAEKDVTLIARGHHLDTIQKNGLEVETNWQGTYTVSPIKACDSEHYEDQPDVIFVCVKGYSLAEIVPFIKRVAHKNTVVIPILNIYGTGEKLQALLPELLVTDGCIYISANITDPGKIKMHGEIFRVFFGIRDPAQFRPVLKQIEADLNDSGILGVLSPDIRKDALQKFSYVSAMAACGLYYHVEAGAVQKPGEIRDTYIDLLREIKLLALAMDIHFDVDIIEFNLDILDSLAPTASTSMQRDINLGKKSEIDGLVFEVLRMGEHYHVPMPTYQRLAQTFDGYAQ
ncbi:ketopantoate reductase family protein [Acetobacterium sp.]|uniref:ketopantoate reductase family protein n=1 Tax=Acetobacterium sp. TaxID=1872094 RepID=UPI0027254EB1|nr:2-dehydropantoate 2-reductase [Acetobacterium sp.]MDO9493996.1 2-dehydropantoate 2-reductase [Acetobacterium sp.]